MSVIFPSDPDSLPTSRVAVVPDRWRDTGALRTCPDLSLISGVQSNFLVGDSSAATAEFYEVENLAFPKAD